VGSGAASSLRKKYKRYLNLFWGLICLRYHRPEDKKAYKDYKPEDDTCIIPLKGFIDWIGDPEEKAAALETAGEKLIRRWKKANAGEDRTYREAPDDIYLIWEHEYSSYNKFKALENHRAQYELHLNTYGFTNVNAGKKTMELKDIKVRLSASIYWRVFRTHPSFALSQVLIKLRFTVGSAEVGDKSRISEGFISDNYGFRCDLQFFTDFLRSGPCARAIQAGQRVLEHIATQRSSPAAAVKKAAARGRDEAGGKKEKKRENRPQQQQQQPTEEGAARDEGPSKWQKATSDSPTDLKKREKKKKPKTASIGLKGGKNKQ
jgi:hypothetical protein